MGAPLERLRGLQRMRANLAEIFGQDGLLSQAISGYRLRTQQLEMAQAVAAAIEDNSILIAEAGTGTGKTFAYLVAALLSGGKVIISTGTKTLQDQLFDRDIPLVRGVLAAPVTVALLKGRANYVCHYHLERAKADGRFLAHEDTVHLARIDSYARTSSSGDLAVCDVDAGELSGLRMPASRKVLCTGGPQTSTGRRCGCGQPPPFFRRPGTAR